MFFVSCVISQIVYSGGGSIFKGGNGSMMIEVVVSHMSFGFPYLRLLTNIFSLLIFSLFSTL